ncbi:MAG: hypothetical protein J7M24_03485 [Candidatus Latescibacteria bacterium]|nr:hypothetical protein [Candidatus Latescibacterota bacterium]
MKPWDRRNFLKIGAAGPGLFACGRAVLKLSKDTEATPERKGDRLPPSVEIG